jgi:hypothetical protein
MREIEACEGRGPDADRKLPVTAPPGGGSAAGAILTAASSREGLVKREQTRTSEEGYGESYFLRARIAHAKVVIHREPHRLSF